MPRLPPPDYEYLEQTAWRENAAKVADELSTNSKRLLKRIRAFIARFGFAEDAVKDKVRDDEMFAAHFAKEPRRTGMHEKCAARWIEKLPTVTAFRVLPKNGPGSIYVTSDGNIHHGVLGNRPGKSLDFTWTTGKTTCYAMHKYTKEGGGHQDSAHDEMVAILRNFVSCNEKTCTLFVIADGPYFVGAKMAELRNHLRTSPPRSYALPIEELPAILATLAGV
jgi:hypothetical protein